MRRIIIGCLLAAPPNLGLRLRVRQKREVRPSNADAWLFELGSRHLRVQEWIRKSIGSAKEWHAFAPDRVLIPRRAGWITGSDQFRSLDGLQNLKYTRRTS